ncbi:8-oxo-dGTP diphosphatase [Halovenus aranensis]|jgi:8-oxo-dGTP diphosphatase|uniref:8-oxo-dGTP diphosphatase n=1 Tax=Halovenus aranensis TaxID=890420 RepID=A0A1G8VM29_9EURY|nr:NUDIX domain-containing protein [Halovenus aranensis]SDJ66994.1 8-oxo-dGTP diphosphatase [Halovenus aranensis]
MLQEYGYVVNVDAAVVRDGEYLLIERGAAESHAAGALAFPGGKVEQPPGGEETIRETARREVREEVGVEVDGVEFVTSATFESDTGTPCINIVTCCRYTGGEARPREPEEVAAVHWLTPTAIRDHDAVPPYLVDYLDAIEARRDAE